MELIVFDLDGTLLDKNGAISAYTRDTLTALTELGIAYTVATGRALHASRDLLSEYGFSLPQIFKNGVMIWDPGNDHYLHQNYLSLNEVEHVLGAIMAQKVAPFIFTFETGQRHGIYHQTPVTEIEIKLANHFSSRADVHIGTLAELPGDAEITNISALGVPVAITKIGAMIDDEPHLVAYSGEAWEGEGWRWIDIHHVDASKGEAIDVLRSQLGATHVVCFGDSDNDISMFERADESYAPSNAAKHVQDAATAVIGDHDEDGIARFLRARFKLDL